MTQAPANAGPGAMQQGNAGNIHAALIKVKNASKMLEEALPLIPFGSEEHIKLQKILTQLSEAVKKAGDSPAMQMAAMQQSTKNMAQGAPMAAMAKMFSGQQGQGQPPAMPSPSPQPEAA